MHYVGISTYQFIPYYASAIHKHTHIRILKPFEDCESTGLKVDTVLWITDVERTPYSSKQTCEPVWPSGKARLSFEHFVMRTRALL